MKDAIKQVMVMAVVTTIWTSARAQQVEQGAATAPTTSNVTRLGATKVQKYDFFLSSANFYWEHTYAVPQEKDSILKFLQAALQKRPEVRQVSFKDQTGEGMLVMEKWELDTKAADGRDGGFSKIYRSGKWSLLATITLHEGGYTVKCTDIGYWWRGLMPGRYMIVKVESGAWRDEVTKNDAFRTKEEREILLVQQNLLKYFDIVQSR